MVSLRKQTGTPWLLCRLLSATILKAARPAAVLVTGDLTDGKSSKGFGRQSLSEWQVCPNILHCSHGSAQTIQLCTVRLMI